MIAVECLVFVFLTCESVSSHVLCGLHIVMFCENEVGSDCCGVFGVCFSDL